MEAKRSQPAQLVPKPPLAVGRAPAQPPRAANCSPLKSCPHRNANGTLQLAKRYSEDAAIVRPQGAPHPTRAAPSAGPRRPPHKGEVSEQQDLRPDKP